MNNPLADSGFLWILAATAAYGIFHSLTASLGAKKLARDRLGLKAERYYRIFFNILSVITLLPVMALGALLPDQQLYAIPFPYRVLTMLLQAAALLGMVWGVWQTDALDFAGVRQAFHKGEVGREGTLVVSGLYRYVRHPLYFFGLVILWLAPVMSWNLLALNIGFSIYLVAGAWLEERKLLQKHGEAYAEYRRKTPMMIPWIKHSR
mgnify:CR=1 FL=1